MILLLAGLHAASASLIRPLFQVSDEVTYLASLERSALARPHRIPALASCLSPPDGAVPPSMPAGGKWLFHAIGAGWLRAACEEELNALVGPGFAIEPPSGRGQQFEAMLASYSMMVSISSAFALFIGMFIIYNSFAIAVSERRSEIGVLRAIGATRGQIRRLFLTESAVLGVVGSFLGLLAGIADRAWDRLRNRRSHQRCLSIGTDH